MYSYVIFRIDDICPCMDYGKFIRFKNLFDKYSIKPIIGLIPDNQDPSLNVGEENENFWNMVKELKNYGWTIAQHGYQHVYTTTAKGLVALRNKSEFAGLSYEKQYSMIKKGKDILLKHNLGVNLFMAPGHSYDKITLTALKDCGFKYVTDGRSNIPYEYMGLKFFPSKYSDPELINGLNTVCIHSNTASEKMISELESFIISNKANIKDFWEIIDLKPGKYFFCRIQELYNMYLYSAKKSIKQLIGIKR